MSIIENTKREAALEQAGYTYFAPITPAQQKQVFRDGWDACEQALADENAMLKEQLERGKCEWNEYDVASCMVEPDGTKEGPFIFCPYCGKTIIEKPYQAEIEPEGE